MSNDNPLSLIFYSDKGMSSDEQYGEFSMGDKFGLAFTVLGYVIDTGSDALLAFTYYTGGEFNYFACTVLFILFSLLVTTISSAHESRQVTGAKRLARIACTIIFPLSPLPRFIEFCGCFNRFIANKRAGKHKEAMMYFRQMDAEKRSIELIRLLEAFAESAPQLVLQLFIISTRGYESTGHWIIAKMCFSLLISLSWTIANLRPFLHSLLTADAQVESKDSKETKESRKSIESTLLGKIVLFIAHALCIASRCITLSLGTLVTSAMPLVRVVTLILPLERVIKNKANFSTISIFAIVLFFAYPHNDLAFPHGLYWQMCWIEDMIVFVVFMVWHVYEEDSETLSIRAALHVAHVALFFASVQLFKLFYEHESKINERSNKMTGKLWKSKERNGDVAPREKANELQSFDQSQCSA